MRSQGLIRILFTVLTFSSLSAYANGVEWSGRYTAEGIMIENPLLSGSNKRSQSYGLHHLVLRPQIVPADGFLIRSRFDIFNNATHPNSQMGAVWGGGATQTTTSTNIDNSNTMSHTLASGTLAVNELYMTWLQEFGALIVGRAPLQFGLGASYSAGTGTFDHWFDNRDMVAYKMVIGQLTVTPMIAKVTGGNPLVNNSNSLIISQEDDVTDYIMQVEYANPETDLAIGAMYRARRAGKLGNDTPAQIAGTTGQSGLGIRGFEEDQTSVFMKQNVGPVRMGLEANFLGGKMGILDTSTNGTVRQNGFGIALEINKIRQSEKYEIGLKAGMASGDDPTTNDRYEGFLFNRNYDIAFLMFNYALGADTFDILRTNVLRNTSTASQNKLGQFDNEAISNVIYYAPYYRYHMNEQWMLGAKIASGVLQRTNGAGAKKDMGYEVDFGMQYKPNERVTWWTEAGILMPGGAFKGSTTDNFDAKLSYGLTTKAAVNF